jgi:hypothetical protein
MHRKIIARFEIARILNLNVTQYLQFLSVTSEDNEGLK